MKYRNNAIDPKILILANSTPGLLEMIGSICAMNFEQMTTEQYNEWVKSWKSAYMSFSAIVRQNKGKEGNQARHYNAIVANTLLNARRYAKDVRRPIMEAEYQARQALKQAAAKTDA